MSDTDARPPVDFEIEDLRVSYEAPRVETVLTAEEMEREALFAGQPGTDFEQPPGD